MASDKLSQRISDLYDYIGDLRTKGISNPEKAAEVLSDALEELQVSLEELSAADEELWQQNEELVEAADEREKHITEIAEANEVLRRQSDMLERSPVLIRDLDDRIITWCQGVEKLYGWTADEALGKVSHELFRTEFPEPLQEIKAKVLREGFWSGELSHLAKDGRKIFVASHWVLYKDSSGKPTAIIEVNNDVTERKKAEQMIQYQAMLLGQVQDGVIGADASSRITYWNKGAELMYGFTEAEALGKTTLELLRPTYDPGERERIFEELERSGRSRANIRTRHKDGSEVIAEVHSTRLTEASGKTSGFVIVYRDITERKKADEALKAERAKLTAILESIPEEVWFADKDMHVTLVNRAVTKNFDDKVDIGQQIEKIASEYEVYRADGTPRPPEEAPPLRALHGETVRDQEEIVRTPSTGELRHRLVTASPVTDSKGNTIGSVSVVRDVTDRKRAEEVLRESEERYRGLFNSMTEGFALHEVICDENGVPYDFRFLDINPAFEKLTGLKREDVIGRTHNEVLPNDDPRWVREYGAVALTGKPTQFENYSPALGRHYEVFAYSPAPHQFAVVFLDITERKQAEEALAAAHRQTQSIIDNTPAIIYALDLEERFVMANTTLAELLNSTPEEMIGKRRHEFMPKEDADWHEANDRQVIEAGRALEFEEYSQLKGRSITWLTTKFPLRDVQGRIYAVAGISTDVSERKRAEEALRLSEEKFSRAFANNPAAIALTRLDDGLFLEVNDTWVALSGYSRDEAIGHFARQMNIWPTSEAAARFVQELREKGSVHGWEQEFQKKSGERFVAQLSAQVLTVKDEKVILSTLVDITERKQAEEELRKAKDELELRVQERTADLSQAKEELEVINEELQVEIEHHQKLEAELIKAKDQAVEAVQAKAAFMANMSHELRTPMNSILGFTSLLLEEPLSAEYKDWLETMRMNGEALLALINDVLDFSKMEKDKIELEIHPFNLRQRIEESLDLVSTKAAEKGLDLAYIMDSNVPETIISDSARLRQVLANLLSNAVKFTDTGDVLVHVTSKQDGDLHEIHFAVQDTGIGMPQDQISKLFQSFSQINTAPSRLTEGTGLGLAISKKLVELMGGKIWAESEEGKGSTFIFTIKAKAAPDDKDATLPAGPQPQLVKRNVLIVEDNQTMRRLLGHQTKSWGMVPLVVSLSYSANELIQNGITPDIAIIDASMPDLNGIVLAQMIRRHRKDLPLIIMTSPGQHVPQNLLAVNLPKPIKPMQLYDALTNLLEGRPIQGQYQAPEGNQTSVSPLRILLAEDNVSSQQVAMEMLKKLGYKADVAANGVEVIQALERQPYDIVLMDIKMPEMDGLEASRIIRQRWPDNGPKIVAITAYAIEGDREKFIEAGMDDYISKPVQKEDLARVLMKCG